MHSITLYQNLEEVKKSFAWTLRWSYIVKANWALQCLAVETPSWCSSSGDQLIRMFCTTTAGSNKVTSPPSSWSFVILGFEKSSSRDRSLLGPNSFEATCHHVIIRSNPEVSSLHLLMTNSTDHSCSHQTERVKICLDNTCDVCLRWGVKWEGPSHLPSYCFRTGGAAKL